MTAPSTPDALDRAWDDRLPGVDPLLDRLTALGRPEPDAEERIRARFLALTQSHRDREGHSLGTASVVPRSRPDRSPSRQPPHRQWRHPVRFMTGVAIGTAIVLLLGLAIGVWLRSDLGPNGLRQELAAIIGLDEGTTDHTANASVIVTPGTSPTGSLVVGAWIVNLAPGGTIDANTVPDEGHTQPLDVQLVDGEITEIAGNAERRVPSPGAEGIGRLTTPPTAWRNDGHASSILLVVAPVEVFATLGLSGAEAQPILSQTVTSAEGHQVMVAVNELGDRDFAGMLNAGLPNPSFHSTPFTALFIDQGSIRTTRGERIPAGTTIDLTTTPAITLDADDSATVPLRAFAIAAIPYAENPTLDQRVESIAPYWMTVLIPAGGEVTVAVRTLTVPIGASYALPADVGVAYGVVDGTASLASSQHTESTFAHTGATVMQTPGTVLTFRTSGSKAVRLIQAIAGTEAEVERLLAQPLESGVTAEGTRVVRQHLDGPEATVGLRVETHAGGGGQQGRNTIAIIMPFAETLDASRTQGEARIERANGKADTNLPLGEPTTLMPGDAFIAAPGGGWYVSTDTMAAIYAVVTVTGTSDGGAYSTPIAAPVDLAREGVVITGDPARCDSAPLTLAEYDTIAATPLSVPPLIERSARTQAGMPADTATGAEVLAMLTSYTDCAATGDFTRIAPFFSDDALREQPAIRDRIAQNVGTRTDRLSATVEDIVTFPDGRAGARVVVGGEYAYLTLVKRDGVWKLDVWDDRPSVPDATPAA